MANPVITAAVLIEANGAALNNSGDPIDRARTENTVSVKAIRAGGKKYPYVSGQAWRRWWRETLYEDFSWMPSPVTRESKSAYTQGDPVAFADDDIFGYMAAKKGAATQRRVSPLKNSLLVSVLPQTIEQDFAHFSRNLPVDKPDMIPFEFEHYSTYLQGAFTIALQDSGRFEMGVMRDLPDTFSADSIIVAEEFGLKVATLPVDERRRRVSQTLRALGRLRHGANLTRNLSDVAPVAVLVGFLDGGNAPFQKLFKSVEDGSGVMLDTDRLSAVLSDYKDRMLDIETPVIFGMLPGVVANADDIKSIDGIYHAGTAADALSAAAKIIENNGIDTVWG